MADISYRILFRTIAGGYAGEEKGVRAAGGAWTTSTANVDVITPWVDANYSDLIGHDFTDVEVFWRDSPTVNNANSSRVNVLSDYYIGNAVKNPDNSITLMGDVQVKSVIRTQDPGIITATCYVANQWIGNYQDPNSWASPDSNICDSGMVPGFNELTYNLYIEIPPLSETSETSTIWVKQQLDHSSAPIYNDEYHFGIQFRNNLEPRYIPGKANFDGSFKTLNNGIGVQANFNGSNQILWNYFSGGNNQVVANFDGSNFERVNVD